MSVWAGTPALCLSRGTTSGHKLFDQVHSSPLITARSKSSVNSSFCSGNPLNICQTLKTGFLWCSCSARGRLQVPLPWQQYWPEPSFLSLAIPGMHHPLCYTAFTTWNRQITGLPPCCPGRGGKSVPVSTVLVTLAGMAFSVRCRNQGMCMYSHKSCLPASDSHWVHVSPMVDQPEMPWLWWL